MFQLSSRPEGNIRVEVLFISLTTTLLLFFLFTPRTALQLESTLEIPVTLILIRFRLSYGTKRLIKTPDVFSFANKSTFYVKCMLFGKEATSRRVGLLNESLT